MPANDSELPFRPEIARGDSPIGSFRERKSDEQYRFAAIDRGGLIQRQRMEIIR